MSEEKYERTPQEHLLLMTAHLTLIEKLILRAGSYQFYARAGCVIVASALLATPPFTGRPDYAYLAWFPVLLFGLIDARFSAIESGLRNARDRFMRRASEGSPTSDELLAARSEGQPASLFWEALFSPFIGGFYLLAALLVYLCKVFVITYYVR